MKFKNALLASVLSISLLAPVTISPFVNSNVVSASKTHKAFSYKEARKIVKKAFKYNKETLSTIKEGFKEGGPVPSKHGNITKIYAPFGTNSYLTFYVKNMGSYAKIHVLGKGIESAASTKAEPWLASDYTGYHVKRNLTVLL